MENNMESYPSGTALDDIKTVIYGGVVAIASAEFESAPERLRTAYDVSWVNISDQLFDNTAMLETNDNPVERVIGAFDGLLSEEDEDALHYINFGFLGYFDRTDRTMFGAILFEDQPYANIAMNH